MRTVRRATLLPMIVGAFVLAFPKPSDAKSAPANSLQELYAAFGECVKVPGGVTGSELTVIFSLRRDGSLLGKPRISHAHLLGSAAEQRDFVGRVLETFSRCLPIKLTEELGGAVAGRPMSFRIISRPHEISA